MAHEDTEPIFPNSCDIFRGHVEQWALGRLLFAHPQVSLKGWNDGQLSLEGARGSEPARDSWSFGTKRLPETLQTGRL